MSEQILVQGKLLGIDEFLVSDVNSSTSPGSDEILAARSLWVTLVCEVVPRALLAELELARLLLGSSGGGQFLIVLPDTARTNAEEFLAAAGQKIAVMTGGLVALIWGITENLGDWTVVRKRLNDELQTRRDTPLAGGRSFDPFPTHAPVSAYFTPELAQELREAKSVGWSPDLETVIAPAPGKHNWPLTANLSLDGISLARHAAPGDEGRACGEAPPESFQARVRKAVRSGACCAAMSTISVSACAACKPLKSTSSFPCCTSSSSPVSWKCSAPCPNSGGKVTILYSGGNDFAVCGSWDALILLARELQRMFQRFSEENLKDFPGLPKRRPSPWRARWRTMTASHRSRMFTMSAAAIWRLAKAADKDCIFLLDRILEWKQLSGRGRVEGSRGTRISEEFRAGKQLSERVDAALSESFVAALPGKRRRTPYHEKLLRRAYRFQRKFSTAAR